MRIALLSDIHANREALDAVLRDIKARGVDSLLCLGDIVGYNADPEACIERLAEAEALSIAGNHDLAVLGRLSTEGFSLTAARAVAWTRRRLSDAHLDWLEALPLTRVAGRCVAVHGALLPSGQGCPLTRLDSDEHRSECFAALAAYPNAPQICAFGHTHRMTVLEKRGTSIRTTDGKAITLRPDALYLVNPGSVGQARSSDRAANYAVLDLARNTIDLHHVGYDDFLTFAKARAAGLAQQQPRTPKIVSSAMWTALRCLGLHDWVRRTRETDRRLAIMSYGMLPHQPATATAPIADAGP